MCEKFGIAVKCVPCFGDKILLLKKTEEEKKGDASDNFWDLPGGRIKYKETAEDAVKREMMEEASLEIEKITLKGDSTVIRPDGLHLLILQYKCVCLSNEVILGSEHELYSWLTINDIINDETIPTWIKDCVTRALK